MLKHINLTTLRRQWLVIVALTLVGGVAAFVLSSLVTPLYRATASLYFTLNFGNTANDLAQGSTYTSNQMVSFGELATAPVVLQPVIDELGLDMTAEQLARSVTVATPRDTVIMDISVVSSDPHRAATIANAIATRERLVVEQFAPRTQAGTSTVTVRSIKDAEAPQYQFSPDKRLNTLLGAFAGLFAGCLTAVAVAALDNRVRNEESLASVGEVTFLGNLRQRPGTQGEEATVLQNPTGVAAEEYRQLRSALRYATLSKHPLVLVVTSSTPGEGKSTVAINLASVVAEVAHRVLLIDADLRRPRLATYAGIDGQVGLTDVLVGQAELDATVQRISDSGIDILPAGGTPPNPGELLASPPMADLLAFARANYDVVIVDTAPVLAVADALGLTQNCDGMVVVARANKTRKNDLRRSLEIIDAAGLTVFGLVLNGGKPPTRGSSYYTYDPTVASEAADEAPAAGDTPPSGPAPTRPW